MKKTIRRWAVGVLFAGGCFLVTDAPASSSAEDFPVSYVATIQAALNPVRELFGLRPYASCAKATFEQQPWWSYEKQIHTLNPGGEGEERTFTYLANGNEHWWTYLCKENGRWELHDYHTNEGDGGAAILQNASPALGYATDAPVVVAQIRETLDQLPKAGVAKARSALGCGPIETNEACAKRRGQELPGEVVHAVLPPMSDAAAGFLWIAQSQGLLNVNTENDGIAFERSQPLGFTALGVNDVNGDVWGYQTNGLVSYDRFGQQLTSTPVPLDPHVLNPADVVVDGISGNLWVAIESSLYRYDLAGVHQQTLSMSGPVVGLALDRTNAVVWVAERTQLLAYDVDGALVRTVVTSSLTDPQTWISDLAFDRSSNELWIAYGNKLERRGATGAVKWTHAGDYSGSISPDGAGGLWITSLMSLRHINPIGFVDVQLDAFGDQLDRRVVDMVGDPTNASVWVFSATRARHYAVDGALLNDLSLSLSLAPGRSINRASLYSDLDPPELIITAPLADGASNNSSLPISFEYFDLGVGVNSSSAGIDVDGVAKTVTCSATLSVATCTPTTGWADGEHQFTAVVSDSVGNRGVSAPVTFTIDTVPPSPLVTGLATVGSPSDGYIAVLGAPGAVEGGSVVTITNQRTGKSVVVVAEADGSFAGSIAAESGDVVSIIVADGAGNTAAPRTLIAPQEQLEVSITSPVQDAFIEADRVLVTGQLFASRNTGVTVNGVVADLVVGGGATTYYAFVPLSVGTNTLEVVAQQQDGQSASTSITVVSQSYRPFDAEVTPRQGTVPLTVSLEVTPPANGSMQVDFEGDGSFVPVISGSVPSFTYTAPGTYFVVVKQQIGTQVSQVAIPVIALRNEQIDQTLQAIWSEVTGALTEGDAPHAVQAFVGSSREMYSQAFDALGPDLPEILTEFSRIRPMNVAHDFAEYLVLTNHNNAPSVHVITFIRGSDGVWRIDSL